MPPLSVTCEEQRLDSLLSDLRIAVADADLSLQHVFSSYLILAGAGHVERSVINILSEYGRLRGDSYIGQFVRKTVERSNSLNCDKIKKLTDKFSSEWWTHIKEKTFEHEREAVDSLKTLRDGIAHGKRNGTGFSVVEGYYKDSKSFVRKFSLVVLGQ